MPLFKQSGGGSAARIGASSDHVPAWVRGGVRNFHHRRQKGLPAYKISIGFCVLTLAVIFFLTAFFYFSLQGEVNKHGIQGDDIVNDTDFLKDVTRIQQSKELKFGRGSISHGRDSQYWDTDDRRRDGYYSEEKLEQAHGVSVDKLHSSKNNGDKNSLSSKSHNFLDHRGHSLYNEAGRNELKIYEAEYEASLKRVGESSNLQSVRNQNSRDTDEYDDGIYLRRDNMEEGDDGQDDKDHSRATKPHNTGSADAFPVHHPRNDKQNASKVNADTDRFSSVEDQPVQKLIPKKQLGSKKKSGHRKYSGCEMKILKSTELLVEPLESRKFARFSLQYTEREEKPTNDGNWLPRFAGHQSLREREESFSAQDQKINCGFVKGPKGSPSTGFDLDKDDANYISSCHIAVMSCIFGNSDRLRSPFGKMVSRQSRKNVCFVMFVDEVTLQTLSSEGKMPDTMGYSGLWRIMVVKNLPYDDMRRVGKIPKFLAHRLFPKARYSIWLDSKLRLQLDPLLILEYFLWRKGYEYAISNHYARHCLWEEVAQNKKLNKYNPSIIDEQFAFYQADGMKRYNASDPDNLLPSNVPEGSFIVRAHTPMSNLFSCLWFNEVERFTSRDQLSFAYTYYKLRRMNPGKPFRLHMFKDCERRKIAKLFHHRSEEKKSDVEHGIE